MTFDIDTIESAEQSVTATVCENAALFGAAPERGEFDSREIWDADDATDAVSEAFRILAEGVAPDGFQLADERESLLWGFVNCLDAQVRRLDRAVDRLSPELRDLQSAQDGTEIKSRELELVTDRARNLGDRRDAFEQMRDAVAEQYRAETGDTWRPRHGSHASQTGKLTSAAIDARDFMRARKDRETTAHLPQGTLVAIAGGKDVADPAAVIARLDQAKAKCADIVLAHGGRPRRRAHRGALGRAQRRRPGRVQARLDCARTGRPVPPQRGAAEPAAEGRNRLPRQRHHRQSRGPRPAARHPGPPMRRIGRSASRAAPSAPAAARPVSAYAHRCRGDAILARTSYAARDRRTDRRPPQSAMHSCIGYCCGVCRAARQRAPHDPMQLCLHRRPLKRRGGCERRTSPATISRTSMLSDWPSRTAGAALVLTPDASLMQ